MGVNTFCCCDTTTYALSLGARKCGGAAYPGVAVVVKQGTTTVYGCTTASSGDCAAAPLPAGTYTVTGTDPAGLALTQTVNLTTAGGSVQLHFLTGFKVTVLDGCGFPISGAVVQYSASGGWSSAVTTDAAGVAAAAPNVNLTGQTVSYYATYSGATTPTRSRSAIAYPGCLSDTFSFILAVEIRVLSQCSARGSTYTVPGASVSVSLTNGSAGSGTTGGGTGDAVITLSPPVAGDDWQPSLQMTTTASAARFATGSVTDTRPGVCAGPGNTQNVTLGPDPSHVCAPGATACDLPVSKALTGSDPQGTVPLAWDAANSLWWGCVTRSRSGGTDVPVLYTFNGDTLGALVGLNAGASCPTSYSGAPAGWTSTAGLAMSGVGWALTRACPPAFFAGMTHVVTNSDTTLFQQLYGAVGTTVNFGVSE